MNVLIVYAHEEARSFNGALKNQAVQILEAAGHEVVVSDLYEMKFKGVADGHDFLERRDRFYLRRQREEKAAIILGTHAPDVMREHQKLEACDLLILQFPLWWSSMPAILKGWVDRVLTMGFAYGNGQWYEQGGLRGRRAMLSLTTGAAAGHYGPQGIHGDIHQILHPIQHGILHCCGFQVLPPFIAHHATRSTEAERRALLAEHRERLLSLESQAALPFHPLEHFDEHFQLKPEHR